MAFGVLHLSDIHFRENETEIQEGKLRQQRLGHADGSPVTDTIYNTRNQRGRKAYCGATWQPSLGNFGRHLDGKGKRLESGVSQAVCYQLRMVAGGCNAPKLPS